MPVSSSTEHWIKQDALTINLNHFGDPDYLQVSVLAGAVVMAFKQDVIGYNAAHNYRTWQLEAANTYLETTSAVNVYAKLTRSEVNARALIAYDTVLRDIEGREITYAEDGSEVLGDASVDYFFVFLGQISESTDRNGGKKERSWNIGFRFGALNTTEQKNYTGFLFEKMFRPHYDDSLNPDKITSIEVLSGLWTRFFISAKGISPNNGGESGSGLIRQVFGYNDLSGNFLNSDLNNTFNAYTIARLSARITALEQNGGGSGGGGVADSIEWEKVLYRPSWLVDKKPSVSFFENDAQYITSDALNPYATQQWVNDKGYAIATDVANTYVTKTTFNTLKTDFDNLSALLNDDVTGKINTWHEVVDFLDEYSGSQDLAAILSGMNTDIASRVEKSKFAEYFNSEMAKWFVKDDDNKGLKPANSYGLYSETYVSAKGVSTGTGGSGGGSSYDRLDKWSDYTSDKAGWILSALLGQDLNNRLSSLESGSALSLVTTGDGNAVTAIAKSGNQLTVTKGSTFQSLITSSNKLAYSLISGTPTSLPASDVAAWAKAASKPSYAFSEITNKPTTLEGYGVTDFAVKSTTDSIDDYVTKSGIYRWADVAASSLPDTAGYGNSITINGGSNTYLQIYGSYSDVKGCGLFWRGAISSNTTKAWRRILDSSNYSEYTYSQTTIDGKLSGYLSLSGGTITGNTYIYDNAPTNDITTCLALGTNIATTSAAGKGVGITMGLNNDRYYAKIATIFEKSNPYYLNPALAFYTMNDTYASGSEVERMRITSGGNVLIGTTADNGAKLQVNGDISVDTIKLRRGAGAETQYALEVETAYGKSWFGMMNTYACHIYTDAPMFYTNKYLSVPKLESRGDIIASGSVTAKSSSDYRLKCEFDYNVDYQERLLSLGKVCDFNYTPHAQKREFAFADDKRHTSVIWQDARKANITGFCSVEEDGYGTINPLSSDLIFTIVGAIQQGITKTEKIEERVVRLEKENAALRKEINDMKGGRYGC